MGIAFLVWSSPGTTTIGENISTGDITASGDVTVSGSLEAKTGRTATLIVAAADSSETSKDQADYVCTGTNDHLEIQAALDNLLSGGGEVKLLEGTYYVELSITLDSNQTLRGSGKNTVLTTKTANLDIITATGSSGDEKTGILIADLFIDGNAGGVANDEGIIWTYVDHSKIVNIWSRDNGDSGIFLDHCDHNIISGNSCNANGFDGILLYLSSYNIISNNVCQGNGSEGIDLQESANNTVSGNTCRGNADDGIALYTSNNNAVSGNTCQGNSFGIYLAARSNNNAVSGNTCQANSYQGIYIDGASNNVICGNICVENSQGSDNAKENIYVTSDSDYNLIANNLCRAPTIGTTLTAGEPIGETEIAVTDTAGFEVGIGVVIDLGGGNEEYHRISAITNGAPGVITIDAGLTNAQGIGETIDVPRAKYGISISNATCDKNIVQGNDLYDSGKTANFNDAGTETIIKDNRGYNPVGVISTPVDNTNHLIEINGADTAPSVASTDYTLINTPCRIISTGGTGVDITIKDAAGNTITSPGATCDEWLEIGWKINWGAFTVAPTITVAFK